MKFTRRDRRDLRLYLWLSLGACLISAYFGYAVAPVTDPPQPPLRSALHGALTSLMIATPIILFELRSRRPGFLPRRLYQELTVLPVGLHIDASR